MANLIERPHLKIDPEEEALRAQIKKGLMANLPQGEPVSDPSPEPLQSLRIRKLGPTF